MRKSPLFLLIGTIVAVPAFAGGHGGGGHGMGSSMRLSHASMGHSQNPDTHGALVSQTGMQVGPQVRDVARSNAQGKGVKTNVAVNTRMHTHPANHGALVSQTAHQAHASGMQVGPQVRAVARSKSQGPTHANTRALAAVNGTHGNAGSNSVLGTSTGTSTRHDKGNR